MRQLKKGKKKKKKKRGRSINRKTLTNTAMSPKSPVAPNEGWLAHLRSGVSTNASSNTTPPRPPRRAWCDCDTLAQ